jgi:hypothetical protein
MLETLDFPAEAIEVMSSALMDFKGQFELLEKNIKNLPKLARLVGIPDVLLEALSPGMIKRLQTKPEIMFEFIKRFAKQLGLASPLIQDSLAAFLLGRTTGFEGFSKALGMNPDTLGSAIQLFGDIDSALMIDLVGKVMDILGADAKIKNMAKALAAFVSKHTGKFNVEPESKADKRTTASATQILGEVFRIPTVILDGVMFAVQGNWEGVKESLIKLCTLTLGKFTMDEGMCRGFISMAIGDVNGIEDLSVAIRFDSDLAEILVILAGSNKISHSYLKQSASF